MATGVEITKRAIDALNSRDLEAFLAVVAPNVEFNSLIAEAEARRTFHGHEGVREWWGSVQASLGGLSYEIEELREIDDVVVVRLRARGEVSEVPIEQTMWLAIRQREGRAFWWRVGRTDSEVIEAARRSASGD